MDRLITKSRNTKMQALQILFRSILLVLALGLEIHVVQLILDDPMLEQSLISVLYYHCIASIVGAYICFKIMMPNQKNVQLVAFLFFFIIIFYLPMLGMIGLILAIPFVVCRFSKMEKPIFPMVINKIREFPSEAKDQYEQPTNLNNLTSLYRSKNYQRRLQAVYATLKLKDQDAIPLLYSALSDPVDDIRLLAYALLDRKENNLSMRIKKNKQAFELTKTSINKKLCLKIANDYWELVRLGLIQGEARNYILNMACHYIELGLKHNANDLELCFLYAQILLKLKNYQQAYEQFKNAENLGIDHKRLQIYYAEIAFYSHQYSKVKQLMNAIDSPAVYPQLSAVTQFWQKTS